MHTSFLIINVIKSFIRCQKVATIFDSEIIQSTPAINQIHASLLSSNHIKLQAATKFKHVN